MEIAPAAPSRAPVDPGARAASFEDDPRKWLALAVLLLAQVMIILDIAIVNVAVPSAQADLQIAPADVQWVVTAYLLPFGGLLLLGGRIADYTGRKRVFCVATICFAIASAVGGAAQSPEVLFAARAFQGLFAAAMAPALLSMLTLGFPSGPDRTRAFSLYGGVSAAGGAFGLVIGGLLTEYLSWRWSLLINVPISLLVVAGAIPLLRESRAAGKARYDVLGAVLGTLGLLGVIYSITNAPEEGWGATSTLAILAAGVLVMVAFLSWESRAPNPLLPLPILMDRTRAGGFVALAVLYGPPTGMTLLVLIFLQGPLGEGALTAGLYFTPIPIAAMFGALASMRLLPRVSPRLIIAAGSLLAAGGLLALTRIGLDANFAEDMLPGFALFGLGSSVMFVAGNAIALSGVPDRDTGLASGVVNAVQQVGAALGVAIMSAVAANATASYLADNGPASAADAIVHGNNVAFVLGATILLTAGLIAALLIASNDPIISRDLGEPATGAPPEAAQPVGRVDPEIPVSGTIVAATRTELEHAERDDWVPMAARLARIAETTGSSGGHAASPAAAGLNGARSAGAKPNGSGPAETGSNGARSTGARPNGAASAGDAAEELLMLALAAGRGVAAVALRTGKGAAGQAIGAGRDVAGVVIRRVDRRPAPRRLDGDP